MLVPRGRYPETLLACRRRTAVGREKRHLPLSRLVERSSADRSAPILSGGQPRPARMGEPGSLLKP
jgi:hypothetical protein